MFDSIFQKLTPNSLVLTANQRLSHYCQQAWERYTLLSEFPQFSAPIMTLENWTYQLAQQYLPAWKLLSEIQETRLWLTLIEESMHTHLLFLSKTVNQAAQAWKWLHQWQLPLSTISTDENVNVEAFYRWASRFAQYCRDRQCMTQAELLTQLSEEAVNWDFTLDQIILVGFYRNTPQLETFFGQLRNKVPVIFYEGLHTLGENVRVELVTAQEEIDWVSHEIKMHLTKNSNLRTGSIACIVPNLAERRPLLERAFLKTFEPAAFQFHHRRSPLFHFSLGKSLADEPLVQAIFLALDASEEVVSWEIALAYLRCPFLGQSEVESVGRVALEKQLMEHQEAKLFSAEWRRMAQKSCPEVSQTLKGLHKFRQKHTQHTPSEWSEALLALVDILHWPGELPLDSENFQRMNRCTEWLTDFGQLSSLCEKLSFSEMVSELKRQAHLITFEPDHPEALIQIVGVLEAQFIPFDRAWVLGCAEEKFPALGQPNPFLPLRLQKQHAMPQSCAKEEKRYYQELLQRLSTHIPKITFSYSLKDRDQLFHPSTLIQNLPMSSVDWEKPVFVPSSAVEYCSEPQVPAGVCGKDTFGSHVFKLQAACPFKAFAEIRLKAKCVPSPSLGMTPIERGLLLHSALEALWMHIMSSEKLEKLKQAGELTLLIHSVVEAILREKVSTRPFLFTPAFRKIEEKRLHRLLEKAVEQERQRPAFRIVSQEKEVVVPLFGLSLRLRVDRIDQLSDGTHLLIDYKTGACSTSAWFGERLDEPQLPLYALAYGESVKGLAFVELNAYRQQWKGIHAEESGIEGLLPASAFETNWSSLIHEWEMELNVLAEEFLQGIATVSPKYGEQTCQFCGLKSLCRITSIERLE